MGVVVVSDVSDVVMVARGVMSTLGGGGGWDRIGSVGPRSESYPPASSPTPRPVPQPAQRSAPRSASSPKFRIDLISQLGHHLGMEPFHFAYAEASSFINDADLDIFIFLRRIYWTNSMIGEKKREAYEVASADAFSSRLPVALSLGVWECFFERLSRGLFLFQ